MKTGFELETIQDPHSWPFAVNLLEDGEFIGFLGFVMTPPVLPQERRP